MIDYDKYKGHTPGPLHVEPMMNHSDDTETGHYFVCNEQTECDETVTAGVYDFHASPEERKATAHLFADAPLLLARCLELEEEKANLIHDNADYVKTASELATENCDLREALEKIIQMNIDYCRHKYGDPEQAETMGCVVTARQALNKAKGGE